MHDALVPVNAALADISDTELHALIAAHKRNGDATRPR